MLQRSCQGLGCVGNQGSPAKHYKAPCGFQRVKVPSNFMSELYKGPVLNVLLMLEQSDLD